MAEGINQVARQFRAARAEHARIITIEEARDAFETVESATCSDPFQRSRVEQQSIDDAIVTVRTFFYQREGA